MKKGWLRFGIVVSLAWLLGVCALGVYEWQAPFYKKEILFRVVPHPEQAAPGEAIPVTTPFMHERFIALLILPPLLLWALLLAWPSVVWVKNGFKT